MPQDISVNESRKGNYFLGYDGLAGMSLPSCYKNDLKHQAV